jgi:hypothetical protein
VFGWPTLPPRSPRKSGQEVGGGTQPTKMPPDKHTKGLFNQTKCSKFHKDLDKRNSYSGHTYSIWVHSTRNIEMGVDLRSKLSSHYCFRMILHPGSSDPCAYRLREMISLHVARYFNIFTSNEPAPTHFQIVTFGRQRTVMAPATFFSPTTDLSFKIVNTVWIWDGQHSKRYLC